MTAKLIIEIEAPLTEDDLHVLNGAAMTIMSLIGSMAADEDASAAQVPGDEVPDPIQQVLDAVAEAYPDPEPPPQPCGKPGTDGKVCISAVGHIGRHLFRRPVSLSN